MAGMAQARREVRRPDRRRQRPGSDHIGTNNGGLTMVTFAMIVVVQDVQGMNDNIFKDKWKRAPFIAVN